MPHVVWAEESKTGLSFENGERQQKYQHKSTLQSLANQAVQQPYSDSLQLPRTCFCYLAVLGPVSRRLPKFNRASVHSNKGATISGVFRLHRLKFAKNTTVSVF